MRIKNIQLGNLDVYFAIIGITTSIILTIYTLNSNQALTYSLPGLLVLVSCLIWLFIRKSFLNLESLNFEIYESKNSILLLISLFFILLTFTILSIYYSPNLFQRPLIYFIMMSLMISFVMLELLFNHKNKYSNIILLQIIIIELSLVWSQQLIFPSLTGIDPAYHYKFTNYILNIGHIPLDTNYSTVPLFHLEIAITSLLSTLNYKLAAIFSIDIIRSVVIILVIFLIGRYLYNDNVGLLSGLFLSFANIYVQFGWWTVPNTIAVVFVPLIIYLLLFKKRNYTIINLIIILMWALILTHPVTSLWMLFILLTGVIIFGIIKILQKLNINSYKINYNNMSFDQISMNIFLFFSIFMFAWWMYSSGIFNSFFALFSWGVHVDKTISAGNYWNSVPIQEHIIDNLGLFIYFGISIIGFLYILLKRNLNAILIGSFGMMTLSIGFFSIIGGSEFLNVRWWYFAQILLSILVALSVIIISQVIKNHKMKYIFLGSFIFVFSFLMITSSISDFDNTIFAHDLSVRYAFTPSEISAAEFFSENTVFGISSDYDYALNPSSSLFINYYNFDINRISAFDTSLKKGSYINDGRIKIIREQIVTNPFRLQSGIYRLNYDPNTVLSDEFDQIYDSNSVKAYI